MSARTSVLPASAADPVGTRAVDTGVVDTPPVDTHCPYCALQCGMRLRRTAERVDVQPRAFPTNRGGLCQKGWTSAELLTSPDRLRTPLVRDDGTLRPVSWDEALDVVADGIGRAQAAGGRDAVAVFGGGGL
ncbi:MAG: molybdopterin-dependent oxidoreductase, partial [Mycobacterium leprae]